MLQQVLPDAEISEVGSTAVEGVFGKEDVDIAALVPSDDFEASRLILDQVFEHDVQQLSSNCYQGYHASRLWDVAIQLTVKGGPYDTFHAFNAVLRSQPNVLAAYNQVKRKWDGKAMSAYRQAKAEFIAEVLRKHLRDTNNAR